MIDKTKLEGIAEDVMAMENPTDVAPVVQELQDLLTGDQWFALDAENKWQIQDSKDGAMAAFFPVNVAFTDDIAKLEQPGNKFIHVFPMTRYPGDWTKQSGYGWTTPESPTFDQRPFSTPQDAFTAALASNPAYKPSEN